MAERAATTVRRDFGPAYGHHVGTVASYTAPYYTVLYADGDAEELTPHQVLAHKQVFATGLDPTRFQGPTSRRRVVLRFKGPTQAQPPVYDADNRAPFPASSSVGSGDHPASGVSVVSRGFVSFKASQTYETIAELPPLLLDPKAPARKTETTGVGLAEEAGAGQAAGEGQAALELEPANAAPVGAAENPTTAAEAATQAEC